MTEDIPPAFTTPEAILNKSRVWYRSTNRLLMVNTLQYSTELVHFNVHGVIS
jgi:hypothetical protein